MERRKIKLSIIMPALNEERNIKETIRDSLRALDDLTVAGEVVVVDGGSLDKTVQTVKETQKMDHRIRLVNYDTSPGIGAAFWKGVDNAYGDFVCMIPGDHENDPWEILRYYVLLNHVDMIVPFVFNKEVRSLYRNLLSLAYRFIINTTFLVYFNYTNGTVLYRKSFLTELDYRSTGFFFQTDILIRSVKKGYLFAEVPYRLDVRKDGVSSAVTFPSFIQVIKGYMRLVNGIYYKNRGAIRRKYTADSLTAQRRNESEHYDKTTLTGRDGQPLRWHNK